MIFIAFLFLMIGLFFGCPLRLQLRKWQRRWMKAYEPKDKQVMFAPPRANRHWYFGHLPRDFNADFWPVTVKEKEECEQLKYNEWLIGLRLKAGLMARKFRNSQTPAALATTSQTLKGEST